VIPVRLAPAKKSKFKNIRNTVDGIGFASKAEAAHYRQLKLRVANGDVAYFLRQVPVHLPGNIRYVVDFLEFWANGSVHYVDVKGVETAMFKLKRKQVEALYPITIETVKR
jgi:hypothetical protein